MAVQIVQNTTGEFIKPLVNLSSPGVAAVVLTRYPKHIPVKPDKSYISQISNRLEKYQLDDKTAIHEWLTGLKDETRVDGLKQLNDELLHSQIRIGQHGIATAVSILEMLEFKLDDVTDHCRSATAAALRFMYPSEKVHPDRHSILTDERMAPFYRRLVNLAALGIGCNRIIPRSQVRGKIRSSTKGLFPYPPVNSTFPFKVFYGANAVIIKKDNVSCFLTTSEFKHVARILRVGALADAVDEQEKLPAGVTTACKEAVKDIWNEYLGAGHMMCDKLFSAFRDLMCGEASSFDAAISSLKEKIGKYSTDYPIDRKATRLDPFEHCKKRMQTIVDEINAIQGMTLPARVQLFTDAFSCYKKLPNPHSDLPTAMTEYNEKELGLKAETDRMRAALLFSDWLIGKAVLQRTPNKAVNEISYSDWLDKVPRAFAEERGFYCKNNAEFNVHKSRAKVSMATAKQHGFGNFSYIDATFFDWTGILRLKINAQTIVGAAKNSAIPPHEFPDFNASGREPKDRNYLAHLLDANYSSETMLAAAIYELANSKVRVTRKVEGQKIVARMIFLMCPASRRLLSYSEEAIKSCMTGHPAFAQGKTSHDILGLLKALGLPSNPGEHVTSISDDIDGWSRNLLEKYERLIAERRALYHDMDVFNNYGNFFSNCTTHGSDIWGNYKMETMGCDLEGLNGIFNTVYRISVAYLNSHDLRKYADTYIEKDVWSSATRIIAQIDDAMESFCFKRKLTEKELSGFIEEIDRLNKRSSFQLSIAKVHAGSSIMVFLDWVLVDRVPIKSWRKALYRFQMEDEFDMKDQTLSGRIGSIYSQYRNAAKAGGPSALLWIAATVASIMDLSIFSGMSPNIMDGIALMIPPGMGGMNGCQPIEFYSEGTSAGARAASVLFCIRIFSRRALAGKAEHGIDRLIRFFCLSFAQNQIKSRSPANIARAPTTISTDIAKCHTSPAEQLMEEKIIEHFPGVKMSSRLGIEKKFNETAIAANNVCRLQITALERLYEAVGLKTLDKIIDKVRKSDLYTELTTWKERALIRGAHKYSGQIVKLSFSTVVDHCHIPGGYSASMVLASHEAEVAASLPMRVYKNTVEGFSIPLTPLFMKHLARGLNDIGCSIESGKVAKRTELALAFNLAVGRTVSGISIDGNVTDIQKVTDSTCQIIELNTKITNLNEEITRLQKAKGIRRMMNINDSEIDRKLEIRYTEERDDAEMEVDNIEAWPKNDQVENDGWTDEWGQEDMSKVVEIVDEDNGEWGTDV
eukprot:GHVU01166057.1.p1 GENE.GHVU01166057.1~~GHVU01166057.1.p1  ORF type:complete len:1259 (-),score=209.53 GHVU01166057.1:99-3875(-)